MIIWLKKIYHHFKWYLPIPLYIVSPREDKKIATIVSHVSRKIKGRVPKQRVLFIPSYYQIKFPRMLDITMVLALKLRGAEITPVLTNGLYPNQDVIYGGIYNEQRKFKVKQYTQLEELIWVKLLRTKPLYLSKFITKNDLITIETEVGKISPDTAETYTYKDYPVGEKAVYATINLNNMPVFERDNQAIYNQYLEHVRNCLKLLLAYKKIYLKHKPDVIVSEFPHYYQWHTAYFIAQQLKIDFYGSVIAEKKRSAFFSNNSDQFMDPSPAWNTFKKMPLTGNNLTIINQAIERRKQRKVGHQTVYPTKSDSLELKELSKSIPKGSKVAFFPVNVLFDLAVFRKSKAFTNIIDMLQETVQFFNSHPEYTLILKAHPAERLFYQATYTKATKYCLREILRQYNINYNKNVIFLDYDTPISTFDIIPIIDLGIVYTSTTTVEMAWAGKPILAVSDNHYLGKGFTVEPTSLTDFRTKIVALLEAKESPSTIAKRIELSKKYYLLYYYHAFVNFSLVQGNDTGSEIDAFLYSDATELEAGKNEALDYICDAILTHKDVFGPNRWPPLTT